jgi:hypothetical protein
VPAEAVRFQTRDDLWLEGRISLPDGARGAAVLCHPYPPGGGSMSSILIPLLQRALERAGWASLRFNFRGVGRSEGRFENGVGEEKDARAAIDLVAERVPERPIAVVGWSFGALVGLRAALDQRVSDYVAIAPPVSTSSIPYFGPPLERLAGWQVRVSGICGTVDQYCAPSDMSAWLEELKPGANVRVVDGADHFFTGHRDELTEAVVGFLS